MGKITGLGGVFLRANDPVALSEWYEKHLGISCTNGFFSFSKETQRAALTVFSRAIQAISLPGNQQC